MVEDERVGTVLNPDQVARTLAGWLEARWPGVQGVEIHDLITPKETGFSNETVIFRAACRDQGRVREGRYVMRIEPQSPPIFPLQTAKRLPSVEIQFRAMAAIAQHSAVPIAPLVGYERRTSVLGRPFFIMEYVDGRVPSDVPPYSQSGFLVEEAAPAQRRRLVESGIEALAQIHRIDWTAADLGWLVPEGRTPSLRWQLELYRDYARRELHGRAHPILERAFAWLEQHFPSASDVVISWGDARIGNMIFAEYECAAVTDWEAVALAPPEVDVGWWLSQDRAAHEGYGIPRPEGVPTREEQVAYYNALTGRQLGDMTFFEAFAAMRYTTVFIPLGERLTASGRVPPEMNMSVHNVATQLLADILEIPYRWTDSPS